MKLKKTLIVGGAAAALVVGSSAAFATSTVSVNGSTAPATVAVTGTATGTINFLTNFGTPASCGGGTAGGTVSAGASATSGTQIGTLSSLTFSTSCFATTLNFPVTMKHKASKPAWGIFLDGTPAKGATTIPVEIRGIYAEMIDSARTAPNLRCAVNVAGNVAETVGATVKAQIKLNVVGTTDQLVVNTPSLATAFRTPLVLNALDGSANKAATGTTSSCGGEIQDGDLASMVGTFNLNQQVAVS